MPTYPDDIVRVLDGLIELFGKKLIISGGSGGGFASLYYSNKVRKIDSVFSFSWNPQILIGNYNEGAVNKYVDICWDSEQAERVKGEEVAFNGVKSLILMDGLDSPHLRKHLRRYINGQSLVKKQLGHYVYDDATTLMIGGWGMGHSPPPRNVILKMLRQIMNRWPRNKELSPMFEVGHVLDFSERDCKDIFLSKVKVKFNFVDKFFVVRSNLNDFFVGFQVKFNIIVSENVAVSSDWLSSYNDCSAFLDCSEISMMKIKRITVEFVVEDYFGTRLVKEISPSFNYKSFPIAGSDVI